MANISKFKTTINGVSTVYDIKDSNAIPKSGGNIITASLGPATSGGAGLGDSSHKWSKINGVDPGALGMPSDNIVEITSLFDSNNEWTATADGHIIEYGSRPGLRLLNKTLSNDEDIGNGLFLQTGTTSGNGAFVYIICRKGDKIFSPNYSTSGYKKIFFFPCIGNV